MKDIAKYLSWHTSATNIMFLENALSYKNKWYNYLLMLAIVYIVYIVFTIGISIILSIFIGENVYSTFLRNPSELNLYASLLLLASLQIAIAFSFIVFFKIVHKGKLLCLVSGCCKVRWRRIIVGFTFYFMAMIVFYFISITTMPDKYTLIIQVNKFIPYCLFLLFLLPIQVFAEEILLRSYLMQGLYLKSKTAVGPIFFSALIFSLMHLNNQSFEAMWMLFLFNFISGLIFGLIAVLDDGIELGLGMHLANNLIAFAFFGPWVNAPSIFQHHNDSLSFFLDIFPLVLILCLSLMFFSHKYNFKWERLNTRNNNTKF